MFFFFFFFFFECTANYVIDYFWMTLGSIRILFPMWPWISTDNMSCLCTDNFKRFCTSDSLNTMYQLFPPYNYLFRLLRPDEWHARMQGIAAKNPYGNTSVQQHVAYGSRGISQYISTSASWQAVLDFARNTTANPTAVAVINCARLQNVMFIDLTNPLTRSLCLEPGRSWNFATKYKEVLIIGYIPPYCIERIVPV